MTKRLDELFIEQLTDEYSLNYIKENGANAFIRNHGGEFGAFKLGYDLGQKEMQDKLNLMEKTLSVYVSSIESSNAFEVINKRNADLFMKDFEKLKEDMDEAVKVIKFYLNILDYNHSEYLSGDTMARVFLKRLEDDK